MQYILDERLRQVKEKDYTAEHDDQHGEGELAQAAICYAMEAVALLKTGKSENLIHWATWPWREKDWRPSSDPILNLKKAGALIAAEIDRYFRYHSSNEKTMHSGILHRRNYLKEKLIWRDNYPHQKNDQ